MDTKTCTTCNQTFPATRDFFYSKKNGKYGLDSICQNCKNKYTKDWAAKNKDYRQQQQKEYRSNNKEKELERTTKWQKENRKKIENRLTTRYWNYKKRAKKRNISFDLTVEQFDDITEKSCYLCGEFLAGKDHNGIDRIDCTKGYVLDNVFPCCKMCNFGKWTWTKEEYIEHCKKVIRYVHTQMERLKGF